MNDNSLVTSCKIAMNRRFAEFVTPWLLVKAVLLSTLSFACSSCRDPATAVMEETFEALVDPVLLQGSLRDLAKDEPIKAFRLSEAMGDLKQQKRNGELEILEEKIRYRKYDEAMEFADSLYEEGNDKREGE